MAEFYFLVFLIACVGIVALRRHRDPGFTAYKLLSITILYPYLIHAWQTWDEVSSFAYISPEGPLVGVYPGLIAFALFSASLIVGISIFIFLLARRFALIAALTPIIAGFFYWIVALNLLDWQAPGHIFIDNMPLISLFLYSLLSTAFMGILGWVTLVLPKSKRSR